MGEGKGEATAAPRQYCTLTNDGRRRKACNDEGWLEAIEEEVTRRINNWSWDHMKEHVNRCKKYREVYKKKILSGANVIRPQMEAGIFFRSKISFKMNFFLSGLALTSLLLEAGPL